MITLIDVNKQNNCYYLLTHCIHGNTFTSRHLVKKYRKTIFTILYDSPLECIMYELYKN